jgi:CPA1 family monovalent cation:H+ antiporter
MDQPVENIKFIIILLLIALAVALPSRLLKVPYTLGLVVVGLVIGVFHWLPDFALTPSLVLFIFLPALLFEGAWNLELRQLLRNWLPITLLAGPGLMVSVLIVGLLMHFAAGLPWSLAFLLGAIISPTDPVAVLALFRQMGLASRLRVLIDGESLFNDGVAAAITQVLLAIVVGTAGLAGGIVSVNGSSSALNIQAVFSPGAITVQIVLGLLVLVGGGIGLGVAIGFLVSRLVRYVDDHLIETTITAVVAYGAYLLGDALHVSGILAVITTTLVLGSYGREHGMSQHTQEAVDGVWEFVAYLANSLLFLLMGLQISLFPLNGTLIGIGWAVVSVVAGRALMIYLCIPFHNLLAYRLAGSKKGAYIASGPIPRRWRLLLLGSGLRGALSLALALALPVSTPERQRLIVIVYGVVLVTLLGQGFGLRLLLPLLRRERQLEPRPKNQQAEMSVSETELAESNPT